MTFNSTSFLYRPFLLLQLSLLVAVQLFGLQHRIWHGNQLAGTSVFLLPSTDQSTHSTAKNPLAPEHSCLQIDAASLPFFLSLFLGLDGLQKTIDRLISAFFIVVIFLSSLQIFQARAPPAFC